MAATAGIDRIRAEQVRTIYRNAPPGLFMTLVAVSVMKQGGKSVSEQRVIVDDEKFHRTTLPHPSIPAEVGVGSRSLDLRPGA